MPRRCERRRLGGNPCLLEGGAGLERGRGFADKGAERERMVRGWLKERAEGKHERGELRRELSLVKERAEGKRERGWS